MTIIDKLLAYNSTTPKSPLTIKECVSECGKKQDEDIQCDSSTFSKIPAQYSRDQSTGTLFNIEEKESCHFESHWNTFHESFKNNAITNTHPMKVHSRAVQV